MWAFLGSAWVVYQPRYRSALTPSDVGIDSWQPLQLITEDKVTLSSWLIRTPGARGILLLIHGFGTSKADLLDVAASFHRAGKFHLILVDLRAHGDSGGNILSFGKKEVLDVKAVLSYIDAEPSLKRLPFGCYGLSMGGAISILAAAEYPEIRAVVSDSSYSDLGKAIARALQISYDIPRLVVGQTIIWGTQARIGASALSLSPASVVLKISPRPVLIIHGTADLTTPYHEGEEIYNAAVEPKQLWRVQDAEHVSCFYLDKEGYTKRVLEFFTHGFFGKT